MGKQINMGGYTKTEYSELADELRTRLSVLGVVNVRPHRGLMPHNFVVEIIFDRPPVIVDWKEQTGTDFLLLNVAGGGVMGHGNAWIVSAPRPGATTAAFAFNLSIDSNDTPLAMHDERLLIEQIDSFAEKAKNGFCYDFSDLGVIPWI